MSESVLGCDVRSRVWNFGLLVQEQYCAPRAKE